jgi:hypothetical protein
MSATSDFYLARAADSARDAQNANLANVRERCLRAEAAWLVMAERLLRSEADRKRHAADKAEQTAAEQ